jgi:hypothetical protein
MGKEMGFLGALAPGMGGGDGNIMQALEQLGDPEQVRSLSNFLLRQRLTPEKPAEVFAQKPARKDFTQESWELYMTKGKGKGKNTWMLVNPEQTQDGTIDSFVSNAKDPDKANAMVWYARVHDVPTSALLNPGTATKEQASKMGKFANWYRRQLEPGAMEKLMGTGKVGLFDMPQTERQPSSDLQQGQLGRDTETGAQMVGLDGMDVEVSEVISGKEKMPSAKGRDGDVVVKRTKDGDVIYRAEKGQWKVKHAPARARFMQRYQR